MLVINAGEQLDDHFEERCAILEYDASYTRYQAEQTAAQQMGYANKSELKSRVQELKSGVRL